MSSNIVGVVLPGTSITPIIEKVLSELSLRKNDDTPPSIKLGTGLVQSSEDVIAVRAGLLYFIKPNKFWIESHQKRYIAVPNDLVIGVVVARLAESYKIDLGSSSIATLNFTGFEAVTKKNRPNLNIGDIVYARVSVANKDLEPELVCLDSNNKAEGFGEVKKGMVFKCSCSHARSLQSFDNWILEGLGKHFAFEIIVGANGRFIIDASKPQDVLKLGNIILEAEKRQQQQQDKKWLMEKIKEFSRSS